MNWRLSCSFVLSLGLFLCLLCFLITLLFCFIDFYISLWSSHVSYVSLSIIFSFWIWKFWIVPYLAASMCVALWPREPDRQWLYIRCLRQPWQTGSEGTAVWQNREWLPARRGRSHGLTPAHRGRRGRWFTDLTVSLTRRQTNKCSRGREILWIN